MTQEGYSNLFQAVNYPKTECTTMFQISNPNVQKCSEIENVAHNSILWSNLLFIMETHYWWSEAAILIYFRPSTPQNSNVQKCSNFNGQKCSKMENVAHNLKLQTLWKYITDYYEGYSNILYEDYSNIY